MSDTTDIETVADDEAEREAPEQRERPALPEPVPAGEPLVAAEWRATEALEQEARVAEIGELALGNYKNDFVQIASGAAAIVEAQSTWENQSGILTQGFPTGIVIQTQYNKAWRQSTAWIRSLGYHVSQTIRQDVLDDGDYMKLWRQLYEGLLVTPFSVTTTAINDYVVPNNYGLIWTAPPAQGTEITLWALSGNTVNACSLNWNGTGTYPIRHMNGSSPLLNELAGLMKLMFVDGVWWIIALNINMTTGRWLPLTGGTLTGPLIINSTLEVWDATYMHGALTVIGAGSVGGGLSVSNGITSHHNLQVTGSTNLTGALVAQNTVTINNYLTVNSGASVRDQFTGGSVVSLGGLVAVNAAMSGYITAGGNLTVTGGATVGSLVTAGDVGARHGTFSGNLTVTGSTSTGGLAAANGSFSGMIQASGNIQSFSEVIGNTIGSVGALTSGSTIHAVSHITTEGNLTVDGTATFEFVTVENLSATDIINAKDITCETMGATQEITVGTTCHVVGATSMQSTLTTSGFCYNSDALWHAISDREIKRGIEPYQRGLPALRQIQPVRFRYTDDAPVKLADEPDAIQFGFVAQDVEEIIPEMVGSITIPPVIATEGRAAREGRALKTVAPGHLVYLLVNAVQELAERLERLEGGSAPKAGDA